MQNGQYQFRALSHKNRNITGQVVLFKDQMFSTKFTQIEAADPWAELSFHLYDIRSSNTGNRHLANFLNYFVENIDFDRLELVIILLSGWAGYLSNNISYAIKWTKNENFPRSLRFSSLP